MLAFAQRITSKVVGKERISGQGDNPSIVQFNPFFKKKNGPRAKDRTCPEIGQCSS